MNQELYDAIGNALDAIPPRFFDPDTPLDEREASRLEYCAATDEVYIKFGITADEWENELERRLDEKYCRDY